MHRVFVVRSMDGNLSIDIHAVEQQAIAARAFTTGSPSTLVIDIAAADTPSTRSEGATSPVAIVMTPSPGPALYPVSIEGYAAPGAKRLEIDFIGADDFTANRTIQLIGFNDAWQGFTSVITDGPQGETTLFVGTHGPEGDQDEGVIVVLDLP